MARFSLYYSFDFNVCLKFLLEKSKKETAPPQPNPTKHNSGDVPFLLMN